MPRTNILLLNNEEHTRDTISGYLSEHDFNLQTASDCQTAVEIVRMQQFNVALVDLPAGDISGMEAAQQIKSLQCDSATHILPLTFYQSHFTGHIISAFAEPASEC